MPIVKNKILKEKKRKVSDSSKVAEIDRLQLEEKLSGANYCLCFLIPASGVAESLLKTFVQRCCSKRERRAVVALSKADLFTMCNISKEDRKCVEKDVDRLTECVRKCIYDLLIENEKILDLQSKQKESQEQNDTQKKPKISKATKSKGARKTDEQNKIPINRKKMPDLFQTDKTYIEDSPKDGPTLFVALSGFYNEELIYRLELQNTGIICMIKIETEYGANNRESISTPDPANQYACNFACSLKARTCYAKPDKESNSTQSAASPKEQSPKKNALQKKPQKKSSPKKQLPNDQSPEQTSESKGFWTRIENRDDSKNFLKNTAAMTFRPNERELPPPNKEIYDEFCRALYYVHKLRRYHEAYLDRCYIFDVEEPEPNVNISYSNQWKYIPTECQSVSLFLNCILQEATHCRPGPPIESFYVKENYTDSSTISTYSTTPSSEQVYVNTEPCSSRSDRSKFLPASARSAIGTIYKNVHYKRSTNRSCRSEKSTPCINLDDDSSSRINDDPCSMRFGDDICMRCSHLTHTDVMDIEYDMLELLPICRLFDLYTQPDDSQELMYRYHVDRIITANGKRDILKNHVLKYLHLLLFEKMSSSDPTNIVYSRKKWLLQDDHIEFIETAVSSFSKIHRVEIPGKRNVLRDYIPDSNCGLEDFQCPELQYVIHDVDTISRSNYFNNLPNLTYTEELIADVSLQELQKAYSKFTALDYEYFEVTDSILLHFHNTRSKYYRHEWTEYVPTPMNLRDFCEYAMNDNAEFISSKENFDFSSVCGKDLSDEYSVGSSVLSSPETTYTSIYSKSVNWEFIYNYNLDDSRVQVDGIETVFNSTQLKIQVTILKWLHSRKLLCLNINCNEHTLHYNMYLDENYDPTETNLHVVLKDGTVVAFQREIRDVNTTNKLPSRKSEEELPTIDMIMKCTWINGLTIEVLHQKNDFPLVRQIRSLHAKFDDDPDIGEVHYASRIDTATGGVMPHMKEKKRVFLRDGSLIKTHTDDSVTYMCVNGRLYWISADDANWCRKYPWAAHGSMSDYKVITPLGDQYWILNGAPQRAKILSRRFAVDYKNDEMFIRRGDGTNIFLTSDYLMTTFPDMTRITSSFIIESDSLQLVHNKEAWVLVKLICFFEHPDYASVEYDEQGNYVLSMPGGTCITYWSSGEYDMVLDDKTHVRVEQQKTIMESTVCGKCGRKSVTSIHYPTKVDKTTDIILQAEDCFGQQMFVHKSGECTFENISSKTAVPDYVPRDSCLLPETDSMHRYFVLSRDLNGKRLLDEVAGVEYRKSYKSRFGKNYVEISNPINEVECCQTIRPYATHPRKYWNMKYKAILPYTLKSKDLKGEGELCIFRNLDLGLATNGSGQNVSRRYKSNASKWSKKVVFGSKKAANKMVHEALVYRHLCVLSGVVFRQIREALVMYWKDLLKEQRNWIIQMRQKPALGPLEVRCQQRLVALAVGSTTSTASYELQSCRGDIIVNSRTALPGIPEFVKRNWEKKQEELQYQEEYRKALQEDLYPTYFDYLKAGGTLRNVLIYYFDQ